MSGSCANGQDPASCTTGDTPLDLKRLDRILEEFKGRKGAVIPILQRTQDTFGYLPREVLKIIARKTLIPLNQLYGVATFYKQFYLTRRGRHVLRVCDGTACHVRGAPKNIDAIQKSIGVAPGATSADYKYTFEIVYCLGSCGLAPVMLVDEKVYGRLGPDALVRQLDSLQ